MHNGIVVTEFSKLPNWIKVRIKEIGVPDSENWIKQNIPALNNLSVIEVLNNPNGEKILQDYLLKVAGKF